MNARAQGSLSEVKRREARGEKSNKSFSNSNFTFVELTLVEAKVRKKEEESKFLVFFWRLLTPAELGWCGEGRETEGSSNRNFPLLEVPSRFELL